MVYWYPGIPLVRRVTASGVVPQLEVMKGGLELAEVIPSLILKRLLDAAGVLNNDAPDLGGKITFGCRWY